MTWAKKAMIASCVLLALAFGIYMVGHLTEKPTRTECIIGFRLDWTGMNQKNDDFSVRNVISDSQLLKDWYVLQPPDIRSRPSISMSLDGSRLYLQFQRACRHKKELAASLVLLWQSQSIRLPKFERIQDPIVPSTSTIDNSNPQYWRDEKP